MVELVGEEAGAGEEGTEGMSRTDCPVSPIFRLTTIAAVVGMEEAV